MCDLYANWVLQRAPVHCKIVRDQVDNFPGPAFKKRGRIVRSKFRFKTSHLSGLTCDRSQLLALASINYVEIFDIEPTTKEQRVADPSQHDGTVTSAALSSKVFYCRADEVSLPTPEFGPGSRERKGQQLVANDIQNGMEVEFWAIPSISKCAAFNVVVVPPAKSDTTVILHIISQ